MEDSHYCLKCGSILVGLDNYINHRKLPCDSVTTSKAPFGETMSCSSSKIGTEAEKLGKNRNLEPDKAAEKVEADNFFSSLELQSSSKTSTPAAGLGVQNKSSTGVVTRSKALLSYQEVKSPEKAESKIKAKSGGKNKVRNLTFFKPRKKTAIKKVAKNKEKKEPLQKRQNANVEKSDDGGGASPGSDKIKEDDDWNMFNHLASRKDEKEGLGSITRYTPELFSMSPILELPEDKVVEVDKFLEHENYDDNDSYLDLEDVDEFAYAPPRCHTGGKWKPGSLCVRTSPMLWSSQNWESLLDEDGRNSSAESPTEADKCKTSAVTPTGVRWKSYNPPSTYTGGKWKPAETPQSVKKVQEVPPATYTGGKWHPGKRVASEPPATHTGGKWRPQISPGQETRTWKRDGSPDSKWAPSGSKNSVNNKTLSVIANCQSTSGKCLKTSGGLIQYYCSPCNRRLASKKMYKKHVMSELHLKRLLQENELEYDSRSIKLVRGLFSVMKNQQRGLGKREIKKPQFFRNMETGSARRNQKNIANDKVGRKRLPKKDLIRCEICKTKLASHQLGKHLVSYYHSKRVKLNDPDQQKLVLDNIHAIVKQAPFQCGICKFYFNTHALFKKHWTSREHRSTEDTSGKKFWCILCNFECDTSRSMELHLDSNSHREVIMAVNKSIPIIIRQKQILNCKFCEKKFRYNIALIRHNRISHGLSETENLKVYPCIHCKHKLKTVKSLQSHVLRRHKDSSQVPYFCSACDLYFHTAEDAKSHRKSQIHRSKKKGSTAARRLCSYCDAVLPDVEELKSHIEEEHPDLRPKCSKCGKIFSLPQELARHKKSCSFLHVRTQKPERYSCDKCAYSSPLKADVLYHETLHDKPRDGLQKLSCPVCKKEYRLFALKIHLRTHTSERPYRCQTCSKTFVRITRLVAHVKLEHQSVRKEEKGSRAAEKRKGESKSAEGPKCGDSKCRYAAKDDEDMEYHSQVHKARNLFQCPVCNYQAKTNTILRRHNKIHSDERSYPCPHCPFRGRLAAHLKRHVRLHTGAKPYKCPHCTYRCNNLENLRKHVLHTKIHPGKMLYDCEMCNYSTNAFKDIKQHIFDKHSDTLSTEVASTTCIGGIYKLEEDVQTVVDPVPVKEETAPDPPPTDRPTVLKNIAILTKKFEPIAPKPENKGQPSSKTPGNSVEDKRKVLEMELKKLKNQAKKNPPVRSYPTPTILRDLKMKLVKTAEGGTEKQTKPSGEGGCNKESGPKLIVNLNEMEAEVGDPSPSYVLCAGGISSDDNEDHLAEQEFYLIENYID